MTFEERLKQREIDEVIVPELFRLQYEYVKQEIDNGAHPIDATLNASWLTEIYLKVNEYP